MGQIQIKKSNKKTKQPICPKWHAVFLQAQQVKINKHVHFMNKEVDGYKLLMANLRKLHAGKKRKSSTFFPPFFSFLE